MIRRRCLLLAASGCCLIGAAQEQSPGPSDANAQRIEEQQQQIDALQAELAELKTAYANSSGQEASKPAAQESFILRKNEKLALTFSGRLHRMLLGVDDGASSDIFFTDSEQGPTMLRFDALGTVSETLSIGAAIETGIRQNRPFLVSQDKRDGGTDVTVRVAEAYLDSKSFGKLSMGRGFAAAWLAPEIDLSGTQFASLLPVGMLAPGMKFVDASNNSLTNIQVLTYFVDVERLLLVDRGRYDSPKFGPGLQLSSSAAGDDRWDLALRAKPEPIGDFTLVGGAAYLDKPAAGVDRRWDAAVSTLHNPSGLNLTAGGSIDRQDNGRNTKTWLVKAGWLADLFSIGNTAFSIDYSHVSDFRLDGDSADSTGLFAVQKWPEYGIDFYAGYRIYRISRPDIDLKDLHVVAMGAALNF